MYIKTFLRPILASIVTDFQIGVNVIGIPEFHRIKSIIVKDYKTEVINGSKFHK